MGVADGLLHLSRGRQGRVCVKISGALLWILVKEILVFPSWMDRSAVHHTAMPLVGVDLPSETHCL